MKRLQPKYIFGFVSFSVIGSDRKNILNFLQQCVKANIMLWDIKWLNRTTMTCNIYFQQYNLMIQIAEQFQVNIKIHKRRGIYFHLYNLWQQKEKIIGLILALLFFYLLSNMIWKIEITNISYEMKKAISNQLEIEGVTVGSWQASREQLDRIEKKLERNFPQLLYVNIEKNGTIYTIHTSEKNIVNEKEDTSPQHLTAAKNGIITKMIIKSGQPVVHINDFVQKGDLLVRGVYYKNKEEEDEKGELNEIVVGAEGEVYANTWYHVTLQTPLITDKEKIKDERKTKYYVQLKQILIPLFIQSQKRALEEEVVIHKKTFSLFNYKLPLSLVRVHIYNKKYLKKMETFEQAKELAIKHMIYNLQNKLGKDTKVLRYYILHEAVDNGKVKLRLYVKVVEDIATRTPI